MRKSGFAAVRALVAPVAVGVCLLGVMAVTAERDERARDRSAASGQDAETQRDLREYAALRSLAASRDVYPESISLVWTFGSDGATLVDPATGLEVTALPHGRVSDFALIDGELAARFDVDVAAGEEPIGDPLGSCCDLFTGTCRPDLVFCDCFALGGFWTEGTTCEDVACPPTGACCDPVAQMCTDDVGVIDCLNSGGQPTLDATCADVVCPPPPVFGSCCNPASGLCSDDVEFFTCVSSGGSFSDLACADVTCPPEPATGACCLEVDRECAPDQLFAACGALGGVWYDGLTCDEIACPPVGACCISAAGRCRARATESRCAAWGGLWYEAQTCDEIDCPGDRSCGVVNPSFETGNLSGWEARDIVGPFFPMTVGGEGLVAFPGFFASDPNNGDFALLHGFDGQGPGTITIAQDVHLPYDIATMDFQFRAAWDLASFCATENRWFAVSIRPLGGGDPLVEPTVLLVAEAGTAVADTGALVGSIDVRAFAGDAVRLQLDWHVPEAYSGPGFFQLDNFRCRSVDGDDGDDGSGSEGSDSEGSDSEGSGSDDASSDSDSGSTSGSDDRRGRPQRRR